MGAGNRTQALWKAASAHNHRAVSAPPPYVFRQRLSLNLESVSAGLAGQGAPWRLRRTLMWLLGIQTQTLRLHSKTSFTEAALCSLPRSLTPSLPRSLAPSLAFETALAQNGLELTMLLPSEPSHLSQKGGDGWSTGSRLTM